MRAVVWQVSVSAERVRFYIDFVDIPAALLGLSNIHWSLPNILRSKQTFTQLPDNLHNILNRPIYRLVAMSQTARDVWEIPNFELPISTLTYKYIINYTVKQIYYYTIGYNNERMETTEVPLGSWQSWSRIGLYWSGQLTPLSVANKLVSEVKGAVV